MKRLKKTKFNDYEEVVTFGVYSNYRIHIIYTDSIPRSSKARYGSEGRTENAAAYHRQAGGGHSHVFFTERWEPGVIAHECFHAIWAMLKEWAGVVDMDNEIIAYHLGFLVGIVHDFKQRINKINQR